MKIGVLMFCKKKDRATRNMSFDKLDYLGFKYVLSELKSDYEYCSLENIYKYDFILWSITSVYDIESLILDWKKIKKGDCRVVVGGAGCINIMSIYDFVDVACFGRCEGQINDILAGVKFPNVWRKADDPELSGKYDIRQAQAMLIGENSIGCKNKCFFCHYAWSHKHVGLKHYDNNSKLAEDDLKSTKIISSGRYITAIDGTSELTRLAVNKNITNDDLVKFLSQIYDVELTAAVNVKLYNIVGYPHETVSVLRDDLKELANVFERADRKTGKRRMVVMIFVTPFSPDPITPMECEPVNLDVNWREELNRIGRQVYKGVDYECFILPQILIPPTVAKRVMIQRATLPHAKIIRDLIVSYDAGKRWQGYIELVRRYLGNDFGGRLSCLPVGYLLSPFKIKHDIYSARYEKFTGNKAVKIA